MAIINEVQPNGHNPSVGSSSNTHPQTMKRPRIDLQPIQEDEAQEDHVQEDPMQDDQDPVLPEMPADAIPKTFKAVITSYGLQLAKLRATITNLLAKRTKLTRHITEGTLPTHIHKELVKHLNAIENPDLRLAFVGQILNPQLATLEEKLAEVNVKEINFSDTSVEIIQNAARESGMTVPEKAIKLWIELECAKHTSEFKLREISQSIKKLQKEAKFNEKREKDAAVVGAMTVKDLRQLITKQSKNVKATTAKKSQRVAQKPKKKTAKKNQKKQSKTKGKETTKGKKKAKRPKGGRK